jgi:hypothetical protein
MTHWWQTKKPERLKILPHKRDAIVAPKPESKVEPMQVEESPGVDGHDTIIAKVKRFWEDTH